MPSAVSAARGYLEGLVIALYVAAKKTSKSLSTSLASHPLGFLFLLLWFLLTWPMTVTLVFGIFGILGAAVIVSAGSLLLVAPTIIALTLVTFVAWLGVISLYLPYKSFFRPNRVALVDEWPAVAAESSPRSRPPTSMPAELAAPPSPISI